LPSFPKAGFGVSGGWNAEIRTGFLRELSDGTGSAGLAARKSSHEIFFANVNYFTHPNRRRRFVYGEVRPKVLTPEDLLLRIWDLVHRARNFPAVQGPLMTALQEIAKALRPAEPDFQEPL
jgi:hypothetical protein